MGIKKQVEEKLQKSQDKMATRLAGYLDDPQKEENVHDARTSLRKLDAAFSLMPKKVRRANSKYIKTYKEFFRANSRVRDCDVIKSRILSHGTEANTQTFLKDIEARRKAELSRAIKLAHSLEAMAPAADGEGQKALALDTLSNPMVQDRADKVIRKLNKKIKKLLPEVLDDETKVEELHKARKDCKKLRYALDVVPGNFKKPYVEKLVDNLKGAGLSHDEKKTEDLLHELQDLLGNVHDSDIAIDYLATHNTKDARKLLALEKARRKQEFQKFVTFLGH